MSSRRLFIVATASVALVIVVLAGASLLGAGGDIFEDRLHNLAEVGAGLLAGGVALVTAIKSRGRRRLSWMCWSAYGTLEAFSDWNVLAAHHDGTLLSVGNIALVAQLPIGLLGALIFMRVMSSRVAVTVAFCDGLLMGGGLLLVGLATGYLRVVGGPNDVFVNVLNLAQPVADMAVLTLIVTVVGRVGPKTRPVALLIGAAILGIGVSDIELTHQIGLGISAPGSVFANGWIAGLLCLSVAALYALCFRRQPEATVGTVMTTRTGLWLPIVPVGLACVFAVALRAHETELEDVLLWVLLALVGLTLTRMYLALYMNLGLGRALAHQASHDSLTGLPNRTLLRRRLERELAAVDTPEQSITLLMLDLDGFKEVNDTFGHSTGDQVLVMVAQRIVASVRDGDAVARLGGDEFAVVLANGPTDEVAIPHVACSPLSSCRWS